VATSFGKREMLASVEIVGGIALVVLEKGSSAQNFGAEFVIDGGTLPTV
jgi:hypothetical protein